MRWRRGPGGIWRQEADRALSPEQEKRREQARCYWAAAQPPEGTLPAEGFIGDDIGPCDDGGGKRTQADQRRAPAPDKGSP
jgi:hypothetical protein